MKRDHGPPEGYYISDYVNEIRKICSFLEGEGFVYSLVNDFQIKYYSDVLTIYIGFEKNDEMVMVEYSFSGQPMREGEFKSIETYSIGWSIVEYLDEETRNKYVSRDMSKLEEISGCMKFFKDYRDLLLDKKFADRLKEKYDQIID